MGEGGRIIKEELLRILFPPRCPICDEILEAELIRAGWGAHIACEGKLNTIGQKICYRCGKPLKNAQKEYCFDCQKQFAKRQSFFCREGRSVYLYRGEIQKSMYRFKYSNRRQYAAYFAGKMYDGYADWIRRRNIDVIVPVPMYRKKRRTRGYNQAELLAEELAKRMEIPCEPKAVRRIKNTSPLKLLNAQERKNNLKKAFQAADFIVKYKSILIVDDIYTTGSTIEAVAQEIRKSGVEHVYFLTLCTGEGV